MDIQKYPAQHVRKHRLLEDLAFIQNRKWQLNIMIKYWDDYEFSFTKKEVKKQLEGCYEIISAIVFEIVRRNYGEKI